MRRITRGRNTWILDIEEGWGSVYRKEGGTKRMRRSSKTLKEEEKEIDKYVEIQKEKKYKDFRNRIRMGVCTEKNEELTVGEEELKTQKKDGFRVL